MTLYHEFLLQSINKHLPAFQDKPWVVDTATGVTVRFGEIEELSRRAAHGLHKLGFLHGDILYYVTYEMAHLYLAMLGAWRLGGATRGCFQRETSEEYERQLRQNNSKFVLVDFLTYPHIKEAISKLEWDVKIISMGPNLVPGATPLHELLKDNSEGSLPSVDISPDDIVLIVNTSGSTGVPKGVIHTHSTFVSRFTTQQNDANSESRLGTSSNYGISIYHGFNMSLLGGGTLYTLSKFQKDNFFNLLLKYQPSSIVMYPYVAAWFARSPELTDLDLSFINVLALGGSILDNSTAEILRKKMPKVGILQIYALTECPGIASTVNGISSPLETLKPLRTLRYNDETRVTVGKPNPSIELKVVDPDSGLVVEPTQAGELYVKSPYLMRGYFAGLNQPPLRSNIDKDGYFRTGDLVIFDEEGYLYVLERKTFFFKYYMHYISPAVIENAVLEHPAVKEVAVVGISDPVTTNLAYACVVLHPDYPATSETEEAIKSHVANRLPEYQHLHGGVRFFENLPENRGGKVDLIKLRSVVNP